MYLCKTVLTADWLTCDIQGELMVLLSGLNQGCMDHIEMSSWKHPSCVRHLDFWLYFPMVSLTCVLSSQVQQSHLTMCLSVFETQSVDLECFSGSQSTFSRGKISYTHFLSLWPWLSASFQPCPFSSSHHWNSPSLKELPVAFEACWVYNNRWKKRDGIEHVAYIDAPQRYFGISFSGTRFRTKFFIS